MASTIGQRGVRAIAIALGVAVTVLLAPWAAGFIYFAFVNPSKEGAALSFVWGSAGIIGVVGFWTWASSRAAMSPQKRIAVTASLLTGVGALVPLMRDGITLLLAASLIAAAVALVTVWLPDDASERAGKDNGQR